MLKKISSCYVYGVVLVILFWSCDSKLVFDEYQSVPNQWDKDAQITFTFEAPDTVNNYNLYINLRNTDTYKYSNLFLLTELNYPNGKVVIDTLEYQMAKPNGELLGKGFTDIKENKLWYKGYNHPFRFNEIGTYTFTVQHAMRKNGEVNGITNLEGVTDIGFRIENK